MTLTRAPLSFTMPLSFALGLGGGLLCAQVGFWVGQNHTKQAVCEPGLFVIVDSRDHVIETVVVPSGGVVRVRAMDLPREPRP